MSLTPHDELELGLLAQANPVALEDLPDPRSPAASVLYSELAARAGFAARVDHRRRRVATAAVAAAAMLAVGAAVAAVTVTQWWEEADPPVNPEVLDRQLAPVEGVAFPPAADRSRARTVARSGGAALVAAPVGESGYCLIPSLSGSPDLGFSCVYHVADARSGGSDDMRSHARPAAQGRPEWILYGRITDPRAATLDLSAAAGAPLAIPLRPGGFFVANVPEHRWSALANEAGPGRILDASGATLRTGCVHWGPSPYDADAGQGNFPFWRGGSSLCVPNPGPTRPVLDLSRAEKLVELRLRERFAVWEAGSTIAMWRAPTRAGGECLYVAEASPPRRGAADETTMPGGGVCTDRNRPATRAETFTASLSWTRVGDGYGVLVRGAVGRGSIVRVALRSSSGETAIAFDNGFLLAQLPVTGASGTLPPGGPYVLVGYDAAGVEVATHDLDESLRALRPAGG